MRSITPSALKHTKAHSTASIFLGHMQVSDGARAMSVTRADVVMRSMAASWARAQMRSIVSCLGSIAAALDHNSVHLITLIGTPLLISNLKPHFLSMTCSTIKQ